VALSVLLTPMVGQLRTVVEALTEAGLRSQVKVVIGAACTTPRLIEEMDCDAYGPDAVAAVRICEEWMAACWSNTNCCANAIAPNTPDRLPNPGGTM